MYLADSTLNAVVERGAQAQSPCSRTRSHSDVSICHRYPIYPYTDSTHNVLDWNWSWLPLSFYCLEHTGTSSSQRRTQPQTPSPIQAVVISPSY